jgi:hydrogenase expression/formation protein HypE
MRVPATSAGERVMLAHGGGGELMHRLIRERFLPALASESLTALTDSAVLPWADGQLVFTTDSYVVTPLEFPGGDIGRLAVAGTVNDLGVMGAEPVAISLALILEEGLSMDLLERIVRSIAEVARQAAVTVVTGDTKVIERRSVLPAPADGMFINTAGIGRLRPNVSLGVERIEPGDVILINGTIADHGLAVLSRRSGIEFESAVLSDTAPLGGLIGRMLGSGAGVKFMRDATRGGIAGVLADISEGSGHSVEVDEERIPIAPAARHAAEMLGLDPLAVANEGKVICVVAPADAEAVLAVMRQDPLGRDAACIARITDARPPLVELNTRAGGRRIVQRPYGEDLPRIC